MGKFYNELLNKEDPAKLDAVDWWIEKSLREMPSQERPIGEKLKAWQESMRETVALGILYGWKRDIDTELLIDVGPAEAKRLFGQTRLQGYYEEKLLDVRMWLESGLDEVMKPTDVVTFSEPIKTPPVEKAPDSGIKK